MRWLPSSKRTPIGIDAGGRFINAVQLGRAGRGWRIEAAASIARRDSAVPLDVEETVRLVAVLDRQGFRGRAAVLAMPSDSVMTAVLEVPSETAAAPIAQLARLELAAAHKCDPQSLEVACWRLPRPARSAGAGCISAVACKHHEANGLIDIFEAAGMMVAALDVQSCAAARACAPILAGSSGLAALLNVGWTTAHLVVLCADVVVFERALTEHGLNRLHMVLAGKFDLQPDVADHLIGEIGLTQAPPGAVRSDLLKAVRGHIAGYLDRLASELRLSLSYAAQEHAKSGVDRLLVHGEGASIPGLADRLSSALDLELRMVAPTDVVECRPSLMATCRWPILSTALGLAQHPDF